MAKSHFLLKQIFAIIFCLCPIWLFAQVNEDFSDGEINNNPAWKGSTNLFVVNAGGQLQLNAAAAGEAYLSTENSVINNAEWEFYVRLAFSPSATNFARIYIVSDNSLLNSALHGYFIQLGEAGSLDGIDFYRQDSFTITKLIDGKAATISKTNNILRIKIKRNDTGNWQIFSDLSGGNNFDTVGNVVDNTYKTTQYFGLYTKFTATNKTKVYFDDIIIKQIIIDTIAPSLLSAEMLSNTKLLLSFDENLDSASAYQTSNYIIDNGIGKPVSAQFYLANRSKIVLSFAEAFLPNVIYAISVNNIKDLAANNLISAATNFSYFEAKKYDIIINEIMPDPSPPLALPDAEYIELYNASDTTITLKDWILTDGTTAAAFGNDSLLANSYAIVAAATNIALFNSFGKVIPLQNLPSLNNTSDILILKNDNGKIIDEINYNISWYKDKNKENGGYSLEKINPTDSCHGEDNWMASNNLRGGTPGLQNSIFSEKPDSSAPKLVSFTIIDSVTLDLQFDEALDSNTALLASFTINNGINLQNIHIYPGRKMLRLIFSKSFISNKQTNLNIYGLQDCAGNKTDTIKTSFIYYRTENPALYDITINEIMANPVSNAGLPNAEFVELYNRSAKVISLKNFKFSDVSAIALLPDYLLFPDSFVVLCQESNMAALRPFCKNIIGLKTWPGLNNTSDSLFLKDDKENLIYFINYNDRMYEDELKKAGGWSLELIDKKLPCAGQNNYTASKNKNGGTPGKENSVNGKLQNFAAPEAINIQIIDSQDIVVQFDKAINLDTDVKHFSINTYIDIAKNALVLAPDFTRIKLSLNQGIEKNKLYSLTVNNVENCSGKTSEEKILYFGLPLLPDSFDVVINEILFNPNTGGSDFVEIYNRSDKILDLQDLRLSNTNAENQLQNIKNISSTSHLLLPKEYIVLTENAENIKTNYTVQSLDKILQMSALPSLPDDAGTIVLLRKDGLRVDEVRYSEDWHFPIISIKDGVSLEKINPNMPSDISTSWHSAASTVGYATPTYQNSQYQFSTQNNKNKQPFTIDPPLFSPDGDGYQDVLNINYKFTENGSMAKLEIYDIQGRLVRQISNNQLLGTEGYLQWDGISDSGNKAPIGVYILLISTFNNKGETQIYKLSCTLAGRF